MTSWSDYRHYRCSNCGEICINHSETDPARADLCQDCFRETVLEEVEKYLLDQQASPSDISERAEGATPSHGGPTDRVSARDDRREDPSQRESPAEGPERGSAVRSLLTAASTDFDE